MRKAVNMKPVFVWKKKRDLDGRIKEDPQKNRIGGWLVSPLRILFWQVLTKAKRGDRVGRGKKGW